MAEIKKTRRIRQTWLKDSGQFEKPAQFADGSWDIKLTSFLEEIAADLDYVKVLPEKRLPPHYASAAERERFIKKMELYTSFDVTPYFDHQYFRNARMVGNLERSIENAGALGAKAIEFWNIGEAITARRWAEVVRVAQAADLEVIFEFHPVPVFDRFSPERAINTAEILEAAKPCFDAGVRLLMIDHKVLDYLGEGAAEVLPQLVDTLGAENIIFEVESDKFRQHMKRYLGILGPDINVSNITPDQAFSVEAMRREAARK